MDAYNIMLIRVTYDEQEQIQLIDDILESTISYILNAPFDNTLFGNTMVWKTTNTCLATFRIIFRFIKDRDCSPTIT